MPAVDRELAITYGAISIGGTTDRLIDGYVRIEKAFATASVEFDFVISATTESAFATEISAVEDAFRIPFKDLLVEQGSSTILDLKPSTDTGLNTQPVIMKSEDIKNTGRSRKYTVRIDCEMPADNAPTTGIRESLVNVAYSPSRRRMVTISGVGTAIAGTDARAKYEAIIGTFCTSILTALGGIFELGEEPITESDYDDKTIRFSRIYDELIYSQGGGADHASIVRQEINVTRSQVGPGDSRGPSQVERLVNLACSYSAWVDKDVTQNLDGLWKSIKSWVYNQIKTTFASGSIAVIESAPSYDFDNNRITVSIQAVGSTGSLLIEYRETSKFSMMSGIILVPVWSGDMWEKLEYQGPKQIKKTTTIVKRLINMGGDRQIPITSAGDYDVGRFGIGGGMDWIPVSLDETSTPLVIGTDNETLDVIDITTVKVEEGFHSRRGQSYEGSKEEAVYG
tara:strand:- start:4030 stop:5391 length:1362 start_codon:yes stop_codon:yes gene_type:complete